MNFHVITIFPDICQAYTDASVLGRAQKTNKGKGAKVRGKKISVSYYNPRDYASDKHRKVDDRPYGGGPGMVMKAEPILKAWEKAVGRKIKNDGHSMSIIKQKQARVKTLLMSPRGKKFDQKMAKELAGKYEHVVLISGRYEGIDARVKKILKAEEVSVGDYVLTGGELPALTIIDAVAREVPGVLGTFESLEDQRVSSGEMYTRPDVLEYKKKKHVVPKVFLSGDHKEIDSHREKISKITRVSTDNEMDLLIALYSDSKTKLRDLGVIRTGNITGDIGEYWAAKVYEQLSNVPDIKLLPTGSTNVDAHNEKNERYSIKTVSTKTTGTFRGLGDDSENNPPRIFEYVIIVELFKDHSLKRILELNWDQFLALRTWSKRNNGWILTIGKKLLSEATVVFDSTK